MRAADLVSVTADGSFVPLCDVPLFTTSYPTIADKLMSERQHPSFLLLLPVTRLAAHSEVDVIYYRESLLYEYNSTKA